MSQDNQSLKSGLLKESRKRHQAAVNRVSEHDGLLTELIREIRQLIEAPIPAVSKRKIGFIPPD